MREKSMPSSPKIEKLKYNMENRSLQKENS